MSDVDGTIFMSVGVVLVLGGIDVEDAMLGQRALSIFPSSTAPSSVNELTPSAPHACFTESPVFCRLAVQAIEHGPVLKSVRWQSGISAL